METHGSTIFARSNVGFECKLVAADCVEAVQFNDTYNGSRLIGHLYLRHVTTGDRDAVSTPHVLLRKVNALSTFIESDLSF